MGTKFFSFAILTSTCCGLLLLFLSMEAKSAEHQASSLEDLLHKLNIDTATNPEWKQVPASASKVRTTLHFCSFCISPESNHISNDGKTVRIQMHNGEHDVAIVDEEKLQDIFTDLATMDLPWQFTRQGCQARAHLMAMHLSEKYGIMPGKAFVEGDLQPRIKYLGSSVPWDYHVAPFVMVKRGGKLVPIVLDPALHRMPIDLNLWVRTAAGSDGTNVNHYLATGYTYTLSDSRVFRPNEFLLKNTEDAEKLMAEYAMKLEVDRKSVEWQGASGENDRITDVLLSMGLKAQ